MNDINVHPDVKAARQSVDEALATVQSAERQAAEPPLSLRRIEHAKQEYNAKVRALHEAREKVRRQRVAELQPKYAEACRKLAEAARKLAPLNEAVADIYEEARQANGGRAPFPAFALPEFLPPTPNSATRVSKWLPDIQRWVADHAPKRRVRLPKRKAAK